MSVHARRCHLVLTLLGALAVTSCSRPAGPGRAGEGPGQERATVSPDEPYDPLLDPLVNPPAMSEPAPDDRAAIATAEVLYRNIDGNPGSLNPLFQSSTYEFYLSGVLFEGLFNFDAEMNWQVNDAVVESFHESDDHLAYTVKMRPGLTWHDGHPFTAHDVVFSWENILDDRVPCPAVRTGTDKIVEVEALDDLTVRMVHESALPTNKWNALFSIIPKHLYEVEKESNPDLKSGDYYNGLNRAPIGNGPYKFVEWKENDKIVFERWDDYYGDLPHFKRHVFRIIPDANILLLSFTKGDVDEFRMSPQQFATQTLVGSDFDKAGGVKVLAPQWAFSYIGWNQDGSNPFFNDVRVRRAMTMACDIDRMRRELTYNLYEPCLGMYHPDSWMFNPEVQRIPYDLDEAAALLDEAGWIADDEREGWRHKSFDGTPVKFEFTLAIPQGSSLGAKIAAIFQEDLKSIGVSLKTQTLEWATFQERTRKHEFQAATAAWGTGTDPDTGWNLWHSEECKPDGSSGRNYGCFKNDRVDELFELARHEFDFEKRRAYYQEIHRIVYDEQPYTFLFNRGTFWGLHERIRGVSSSPRGIFNFTPAEAAWWVPAGQSKHAAAMVQ
jgi:peptide/nickel transport system substrate-binding protein